MWGFGGQTRYARQGADAIQRVEAILGRSKQGIIAPFLCRASDGHEYYVKGATAGTEALVCEWICGCLARELELPIPDFCFLDVPTQLIEFCAREDARDLGTGTCFGSRRVANVKDLDFSEISLVEHDLRARILLFDWWVANEDRTLGQHGGNPNMLWSPAAKVLWTIDHNLSLRKERLRGFWENHAFGREVYLWTESFRAQWTTRLRSAVCKLSEYWSQLPEEWTEWGSGLDFECVSELLGRFESEPEQFWRQR